MHMFSVLPQGSGRGTKPARVQEGFGQYSQRHGVLLGCPVQGQELDSVVFLGPFCLRMFCDSIVLIVLLFWFICSLRL